MKKKHLLSFCMLALLLVGHIERTQAASFECAKATTSMEKLICSNDDVSGLDEELGQVYKEALIKYVDKKDMMVRQQRNWIKWIRSQCANTSCLLTLYEARIGEIADGDNVASLNGPDIPNFVLTDGRGLPLCEAYLNVLNSTPREELRACKLPDLSKSKIKSVEFKILTGEELKIVDQIIYEQGYRHTHAEWEKNWPEREKEYSVGFRKVGEAYWDLDKDGVPDRIIQESIPKDSCVFFGSGEVSELRRGLKSKWALYSNVEKNNIATDVGFKNSYTIIKDGQLSYVDADNFVYFEGQYLSIDHDRLVVNETSNDWAESEWVKIWGVDPKRDDKHRDYDQTSAICKFWFNK